MPNTIFAGQSGERGDTPSFTAQRLFNVYAEQAGQAERSPMILRHAPGLSRVAAPSGNAVRALYAWDGKLISIGGGQVFRVSTSGHVSFVGAVPDGETYVTDNGKELLISANNQGYVIKGGVLSPLSDPDFPALGSVDTLDGYGVFHEAGTQRFGVTGINDFDNYNALDFASAEKVPDGLTRILVDHSELWLFGERSTEVWVNTGGFDFPFSRISGGTLERGIAAAKTAAKMDNQVYWVGDDRIVYRAGGPGSSPQRVSTDAVDQVLARADAADLSAFVYEHRGHKFYVLRFASDPAWCFDAANGLWHERSSGIEVDNRIEPFLVTCAAKIGATWYGGTSSGAIVRFDEDTYTDDGLTVSRAATSLAIEQGGEWFRLMRMGLDFEVGNHGLDRKPKVMVQVSDDARTWGLERMRALPLRGKYRHMCDFRTLGRFRRAHVRWRVTDPVPVAFYGAQNVRIE